MDMVHRHFYILGYNEVEGHIDLLSQNSGWKG